MKSRPTSTPNRPFASLDKLLALKKIRLPEVHLPAASRPLSAAEEQALFEAAMADVVPLADRRRAVAVTPRRKRRSPRRGEHPDAEALRQLRRLVETGHGFVIAHTAEYVEGASAWVPPEVFRRLHGGHFSIRAHIDLHGMDVPTARATFDRFMKRSIRQGQRAVLVVHGRGRCSPGPPVLKRHLFDWLTKGSWKRWVIAFTSARACDGGAGATYVLLRRSPRSGKRDSRR